LAVSIKEQRPDTTDIDIKGRYVHTTLASPVGSGHATIMATIIAGAGNTFYEGKGGAPGSDVTSARFTTLLPEPDAAYQQYNISVQNHSYGTGIENYYGADAGAYDASVVTRSHLVHVFSAGNAGTSTSNNGTYAGIPGFANLTGSFKMAKDILTVGHTDSIAEILPLSSRGPSYDGRIKPELVAFGQDGSSGAAALVSGIALTLQQAYRNLYGSLPSSALIRSVLINSADDVHTAGIDFTGGYGAVNAAKAMRTIVENRLISGSVSQGIINTHTINVPANTRRLKLTLAWTDPPAVANAPTALVNDLDLELSYPVTSETWQPWVLSHYPHIDSLQKLPSRKRDGLNPAEQITLDNPSAGNYVIRINGYNLGSGSQQAYFISYQFDPADQFTWQFPTSTDNFISGADGYLRWESGLPDITGRLEFSLDNGANWQLIDPAAVLSKGYYHWNAPDTFATAIARMQVSSLDFLSDTFTLSKRFNVRVGFDCPDSLLFFWNKQPGVSQYQVYRLGEKYMEPFALVTDTIIMLAKSTLQSLHYAVSPVINNKTGMRSFGFNYTTQGVGCYIKSLLPYLFPDRVLLDLELGTLFRIKSIGWEKLINGSYVLLQSVSNVTDLNLFYSDSALVQGWNTYRVRFELTNGTVFYSDPVSVFYFGERRYIVYPNPAAQGQPVFVQDADPGSTLLQVFNTAGVKVYERVLDESANLIPSHRLGKGIYILRFLSTDKQEKSLKLVIY
jgi:hypothetical protein